MAEKEAPVAEVKARLSEYISLSSSQGTRIVITRRGKPVAALVSLGDLRTLSQAEKRKGLAELIGKWEGFGEIAESIERAYRSGRESEDRDVSL